jgi:VanZ family protein
LNNIIGFTLSFVYEKNWMINSAQVAIKSYENRRGFGQVRKKGEEVDRKRIILILTWICTLIWMGIIFYLSSQPATQSAHLSTGVKNGLLSFLKPFAPDIENMEIFGLDFYIRKNAHFIAYFILGSLTISSLFQSEVKKPVNLALIICVFFAVSDEFHQLFVPGRSGQFQDVLIDGAGAILGVLLTTIVIRRISRRF